MKKIFTLIASALLFISVGAQQVSISIDTIYYTPTNPSAGDSIRLIIGGTANCTVMQQGPTYISDTGRLHTLSVCLFGEQNTQAANFTFTYSVYRANTAGQDTLEYMFFYNQYDTLFCDTVLRTGLFIIQVDPAAVMSYQSPSIAVSWNSYLSTLTIDKLQAKANFQLMDMSGRMIQQQQLNANSAEIKIDGVMEGIYLVYISDDKGIVYRNKIFIGQDRN